MSYTNPNQTADYTLSEGTLVGSTIANSTAATGDVYAKNLTVDNAAVVVSNATIGAGGYINGTAGAVFKNMTVQSGGSFNRTAGVTLSGLTVASGAKLTNVLGGAIKWQGTWNIASGANFGGYTNIYTDTDGYLNMNGRGMAGAIYCSINVKNITINSYLYHYGRVSSGTVTSRSDNGDALRMYANAYAEDIRVLSGGSVKFYSTFATLRDVVADSGAKITLAANNWLAGHKTTFAKGFISDSNLGNVYAKDGVIYNWTTPAGLGAFYFADITLADGDATAQYLYLGTGAETRNFTVTGAAGKLTGIVLGQAGNGAAIDTTATDAGAGITVHSSYLAIFGGTNNNVTAGHILLGPAAASVANADLSIIGDKFNGIELKANTTKEYMTKIKLISGLSAVNPIVSSGGTLYLESGGSAVGGTVYAGGVLQALKGGTISGATVSGYLHVMDFNNASETASANRPAAFANDVDLMAGQLFLRGSNASGANLRVSGGIFYLQNGGSASKVTVAGGTLSAYRNAGIHPDDTPTTIHLDDLTMTGGSTYLYNTVQATNATITGGSMNIRGSARVSGAVVTGGSVTMSGGVLSGASLSNAGKVTVSSGGSALNVNITAGATYQLLIVSAGGYASNVTLVGGEGSTASTNYVYTYGNGVIENITIDAGSLYQAMGGTVRNLTVRNEAVPVARGVSAYISGATVSGGYLHFQNGAKGQDVVVSGGTLYIHDDGPGGGGTGAYVSGVDVVGGTVTVYAGGMLHDARISSGTVYVTSTGTTYGVPLLSGATVTGGTLNLRAGVVGSNIRLVGGGVINVDNATLNDFDIDDTTGTVTRLGLTGNTIASGGRLNGKDTVTVAALTGGAKLNDGYVSGGSVFLSGLAEITNVEQTGGAIILRGEDAYASAAEVRGGDFYFQNGAKGDNILVNGGVIQAYDTTFTNPAGSGEVVNDVTMTAGSIGIGAGATFNRITAVGGTINITSGVANTVDVAGGKLMVFGSGTANDVTIGENGSAVVSGVLTVATSAWNVTVNNGGIVNLDAEETIGNAKTVAGAKVNYVRNKSAATIQGADTNIAASTFYYDGATTANGFSVVNGVVKNLGADGTYFRLGVGSGIVVEDATIYDGWRVSAFGDAVVSGVNISAGSTDDASIVMRDDSVVYGGVLTGGAKAAVINLYENAKAYGTVIGSKGKVGVSGTAKIEDTTIKAGGQLVISAGCPDVDTGDRLTLDFTGTTGNQSVSINDLGSINAKTEIVLVGETAGNTYTIATTGATDKYVNCGEWGLYDGRIKAGETAGNSFNGMVYSFDATGKSITTIDCTVGVSDTAESLDTATLVDCGYAAKWDADTTYSGSVTLGNSSTTQDIWLEIDGTNVSTALYGAEAGFQCGVNIYAKSGTIRNLAAGMTDKDARIEGDVKVTLAGADLTGTAYTGGFGSVMGSTETLIIDGNFAKDFYAGALARYSHDEGILEGDTFLTDVALTVEGGTFSGNIYGASSVKANDITVEEANGFYVHSVADGTTVSLAGGTAAKSDFCCFAGGYATGNTSVRVYYVDGVTLDVSGGSWGSAHGGRGVYGGIMASGVEAAVSDVNLTISGGEMGNVYGGGWAQKGGKSIVGDVTISINGGTVANVFGGGSTSTSGGTTVAGNVTITVSGGNIKGDIFARGQLATDHVTGAANVVFTGDTNFNCDVYGYSYVGSETNDATLTFNGYTGTFAGKVGGFSTIAFNDDSAMTLTTAAADVSNRAWEFDLTDRNAELAETSLLTWSGADFAGDTVKVAFADATQAAAGWSIADAAFTGATFDLWINGSEITSVAYDTAIADGDWAGWKFTDENGTLKFKQLA